MKIIIPPSVGASWVRLPAPEEADPDVELNQLDDRFFASNPANLLPELPRPTMDKNPPRVLPLFTPEALQIMPKLPNIIHTRLALLALDDNRDLVAILQENVQPATVAKDSLTDPLIGMR